MNKFLGRIFILVFLFVYTNSFSQANFLEWAKQVGGTQTDNMAQLEVDKLGNIYIAGKYKGTIDADPGIGVYNITQTVSAYGTFILKLNSAGNFLWAKSIDAYSGTSIPIITIDSVGNVYTCFDAGINYDIDPGIATHTISGNSGQILKLDTNGVYMWNYELLGATNTRINGLKVNKNGTLLVTGSFYGADFDSGPATYSLTAAGINDVFILNVSSTGTFVWAKKMGGTDTDVGISIDCDKLGNIYTAGTFIGGSVDFDPGSPIVSLPSTGTVVATFISKLDVNGNFVWVKGLYGSTYVKANNINIDENSNVLISGVFQGTIDFDPGAGTSSMTASTNYYILKLNSIGFFLWVKQTVSLSDLVTDINSNIYYTGAISGTVDFDPGPATYTLTSNGSFDAYVSKWNSSGDFQWATLIGGIGSDQCLAISVDSIGNVYSTGYFDGIVDLDPGIGVTTFSSLGASDGFVMKLTNCLYNAPNICLVTVDSLALNNVIYWDKSVYPLADTFIVYRYDAFAMIYKRIGAKSINQPNFLIDTARTVGGPNGGDPQYSSSRYKLAIRGNCGAIGTQGLYHESIFIQQNNQNFSWNAYGIEGQASPATGYQFMRDNVNNGTWQVLVNTGGLSTTDPNYLSYPNGNWRVDALGFSCNPTAKLSPNAIVNKSKSNVKNNFVVTSANELELNANVLLSPNPAKTELTVTFSNHQQTKTEFVITDVLGKIISKTETLELNKIILPLNDMSAGVYFLKIKQGKLLTVKKFVKE